MFVMAVVNYLVALVPILQVILQ